MPLTWYFAHNDTRRDESYPTPTHPTQGNAGPWEKGQIDLQFNNVLGGEMIVVTI